MSTKPNSPSNSDAGSKVPTWVIFGAFVLILGYLVWRGGSSLTEQTDVPKSDPPERIAISDRESTAKLPDEDEPIPTHIAPERVDDGDPVSLPVSKVLVENQTIHDLKGNVVFQGTIDLTPTLDRIERGEANRHRNDGTTFQNREGRLPRKPAGYYKEYVHPTPHEKGPGPQRIIVGREGEIWYTPDHYKTFHQVK